MILKNELEEAGLSRLDLARALGWKYSRLNNKMGGFTDFTPEEEGRIRQVIAEAKARRNAA